LRPADPQLLRQAGQDVEEYPPLTAKGRRCIVAAMTAILALAGAVLGGLLTFVTSRANMERQLLHAYDQKLRDTRLESYQRLFHLSGCFPRYWLEDGVPSRNDLQRFRQGFHDWYFGPTAGGMLLTDAAKKLYIDLLNAIADGVYENGKLREDSPLSDDESLRLRDLASDLRHQLAADVGAANPPRLHRYWIRLRSPASPPTSVRRPISR
jgi:hypothetical protein